MIEAVAFLILIILYFGLDAIAESIDALTESLKEEIDTHDQQD